jgi:SNF2 family DNA or RNA helicase
MMFSDDDEWSDEDGHNSVDKRKPAKRKLKKLSSRRDRDLYPSYVTESSRPVPVDVRVTDTQDLSSDETQGEDDDLAGGRVDVRGGHLIDDWEDATFEDRISHLGESELIETDFGTKVEKEVWDRLFDYQREGCRWMFRLFNDGVGGILVLYLNFLALFDLQ